MNEQNTNAQETVIYQTGKDLAHSVFIVSVLLNLAVFIAWLIVTVDNNYQLLLLSK